MFLCFPSCDLGTLKLNLLIIERSWIVFELLRRRDFRKSSKAFVCLSVIFGRLREMFGEIRKYSDSPRCYIS